MNHSISSKLPNVGTTIFTVMSQLAIDTGAINLSQGFPSFDPPRALLDRIIHHLNHGSNQYAPMAGVPALLEAIGEKTLRLQGRSLDVESEITVCCGATEGLFDAIQAVVRAGDEVIVFDPAYDSYEPAVTLAGGVTRHVPLLIDPDGMDFSIDWQQLADTVNNKTRLLIVNFPHNPTGAILQSEDLDRLAEIIRDTDCYLLSDEVYEHIIFDGEMHRSLLSHDELWQRTMVISSFGKTFHSTGWKIGYCIAPQYLSDEFRKVHQFTTFAISTPVQHGIADFLVSNPEFYENLSLFYQEKRDFFCGLLQGSRFKLKPARSTFFQIVDYSAISDRLDLDIAKAWTRDNGVASIPLSVFCEQPFTGSRLRFCFAKDNATLEAAAEKLCEL
jgi:methionine aminotransferase